MKKAVSHRRQKNEKTNIKKRELSIYREII